VTLSPDASLILTRQVLPVELAKLSVPKVNVKTLAEYVVPEDTTSDPVFAQPTDGTPAPPYCVEQFNQPFCADAAESIPDPGAAIHMPDTLPVIVIEN
jgi:hypothetical protein